MRLRCTFFGVYAKKENDRKNGGIHDVISGKFRLGRGNRSLSDRGRSAGGWQGTVHLGYLQPNAGLAPSCRGAKLLDGKVFKMNVTAEELANWVKSLGI